MATMVKVAGYTSNPKPVLDVISAQGFTYQELALDEMGLQILVKEDLDTGEEAALSSAVVASVFSVTFSKV